jgi:GNAT superfamily N-acetyltransferase
MDVDATLAATQLDLFWLPPDARVVSRPEIVYLACDRDVGYLNSVLAFDAADASVPALVAEVAAAHARVTSRFMLGARAQRPAVERALEAAGYEREHELLAYAIDVDAYRPRPNPGVVARRVATLADLEGGLDAASRAFGRGDHLDHDARLRELDACTRPGARVARFVAWDEATGAPLASAGITLFPALDFGLLWAGGTVPEARGRGAYSALVAARVAEARARGLRAVGLYARATTSAPIVDKQGFSRHGTVPCWARPPR